MSCTTENYIYSYYCSVDINECETGAHDCSQGCNNTEGSYQCFCYVGYMLEADLRNCSGKFAETHIVYYLLHVNAHMALSVILAFVNIFSLIAQFSLLLLQN